MGSLTVMPSTTSSRTAWLHRSRRSHQRSRARSKASFIAYRDGTGNSGAGGIRGRGRSGRDWLRPVLSAPAALSARPRALAGVQRGG